MITEAKGRAIVMERSGGRCELTGQAGDSIHHKQKRSAGGSWAPSNLLRLSGSGTTGAHGAIEANPYLAMRLGLWIPLGGDPAAPALCRPHLFGLDWWTSDDDGMWHWHHRATASDLTYLTDLLARRSVNR